MSDDKKGKSFWTSLPGILTGVAALIAAVTGLYIAIGAPRSDNGEPPKPLRIAEVNSRNPDYVEIRNSSAEPKDVSGFKITVGNEPWYLPQETVLVADGRLRVYFFSKENRETAASYQARGELVAIDIGIKSGERVILTSASGALVDETNAP